MVDRAALADIDKRIQIVEDNLRELIEQAAAYSGAADEERNADRIADQAEASPVNEQAGKPAGNCADDQCNDECCQHGFPPWLNDRSQSSIYENLTDTLSGGSYKGTIELP